MSVCLQKDELRNLVSDCAKSPVYQTRELAARALVPLLTESTVLSTLKNLFEHVKHLTKQSHGYLLQVSVTKFANYYTDLNIKIVLRRIMCKGRN